MKFWKKALAFLMSISAVCALGACGGKSGDGDTTSSPTTSEEAEARTYYGATIEFYVSPVDPVETDGIDYVDFSGYPRSVLNNMVGLLQSDSFAEILVKNEGVLSEDAVYAETLALYKTCVTYSFQNKKDETDGSLMRSFLLAEIAVLKESEADKAVAEEIREQVIDFLPLYVEQNMPLMGGYNGTLCKRVTHSDQIVEFEK